MFLDTTYQHEASKSDWKIANSFKCNYWTFSNKSEDKRSNAKNFTEAPEILTQLSKWLLEETISASEMQLFSAI